MKMENILYKIMNNSKFKTEVRSDSNVSHDRNVNELSKIYFNKIKKENYESISKDEIINVMKKIFIELNNITIDPIKKQKVSNYLNFLVRNNDNIVNFNCDEERFIILCWYRIQDKLNESKKQDLIESFFNSIADCFEIDEITNLTIRYKLICTSGRIMKILSTFAFLDYDEELGLFISSEMLKKDFFSNASVVFSEEMSKNFYEEILNDLIKNYDVKFFDQLNKYKKELLDNLLFINESSLQE
jgi:hypothetical protein